MGQVYGKGAKSTSAGAPTQQEALLTEFGNNILQAAQGGWIDDKRPVPIWGIEGIAGPNAGVLEISAGPATRKLYKELSADDCALLRQLVPPSWDMEGEPAAYMWKRVLRIEVGWPDSLATKDSPLTRATARLRGQGTWVAGRNEFGHNVLLAFSSTIAHYLVAGASGMGKTWEMRSALAQMSQDPNTRLVLIDLKWGDGLGILARLPGLVGPVATEPESARRALAWTDQEMKRRYQTGDKGTLLVVAIDEVQELTKKTGGDPLVTAIVDRLARLGRSANIHLLLGTQNPVVDALGGDSFIKRNVLGKVALRVDSAEASRVVVGGPKPRADRLVRAGDAYTISSRVSRVMLSYIPLDAFERDWCTGTPELAAWPDFEAECLEGEPDDAPDREVTGMEVALALELAAETDGQGGRDALKAKVASAGLKRPGTPKANWYLTLGRETREALAARGWRMCKEADCPALTVPDRDVEETSVQVISKEGALTA